MHDAGLLSTSMHVRHRLESSEAAHSHGTVRVGQTVTVFAVDHFEISKIFKNFVVF